jgi:hypothetical protein
MSPAAAQIKKVFSNSAASGMGSPSLMPVLAPLTIFPSAALNEPPKARVVAIAPISLLIWLI